MTTSHSSRTARMSRSTSCQNANVQTALCRDATNCSSVEQPQESNKPEDSKISDKLIAQTAHRTSRPKCPPTIAPEVRLKWGLRFLGKEKAEAYLEWLLARQSGLKIS